MLAGLCSVAVLQEREQRSCRVSRSSNKIRLTPRDEWTFLLRGTAETGSWGFRALLGYPGFANLPAKSKQPPKPCTPHRALPRSPALPSTQGRHQRRHSPQMGWALSLQQLPEQLRQCQRREGAPRTQAGSVCVQHHPRAGHRTEPAGRGTQEHNRNLPGLCVQRNGPSQGEQRLNSALC